MDIAHLIQTAIAPVFLLTGVAARSACSPTGCRASSIARASWKQQLEGHPGQAATLLSALQVLARRARYINVAISLSTIAALLVALVVVTLFANAWLRLGARRGSSRCCSSARWCA